MSDFFEWIYALVVVALFGVIIAAPFCICAKRSWTKLLPTMFLTGLWLTCMLGAINVIDLPRIYFSLFSMQGGFNSISDSEGFLWFGWPTIIGSSVAFALERKLRAAWRRRKETEQAEDDDAC